MNTRGLLLAGVAAVLAGCIEALAAADHEERTVLVDYDHDQVASTFTAYFPDHVEVHAGDEVVFRQQWTGEGHSVTMGTYADELMAIARPLLAQVSGDKEPPPEDFWAPIEKASEKLPFMIGENDNVNQNGAQPCFLDSGVPPKDPDTPCTDAQQRQPAFNGRQSYYNSGFIPYEGPRGNEYRVRLSDDIEPGTYSYYCNLHWVFQSGTIEVVPDDVPIPPQREVSRQAYEQIKATASPLLQAYREALNVEGNTKVVGLRVSKPFAGWLPSNIAIPAWINEFVPRQVQVEAGQSVTWSFVGSHTVSFDVPAYFSEFVVAPDGTVEWSRDAVEPRPRRLDVQRSPPASEGATSDVEGGSGPAEQERLDGGRWDGAGFVSSGLQYGEGTTFSLTFTRPGVYPYACLIHPRMVGEVIVR